jgi:hypothetical protein
MGEPGDAGLGICLLEFSEKRSRTDDVADRPEFDQKDAAVCGVVVFAVGPVFVNAMNTVGFMGAAGDVAAEVAAVGFERDHARSYFSCSRME